MMIKRRIILKLITVLIPLVSISLQGQMNYINDVSAVELKRIFEVGKEAINKLPYKIESLSELEGDWALDFSVLEVVYGVRFNTKHSWRTFCVPNTKEVHEAVLYESKRKLFTFEFSYCDDFIFFISRRHGREQGSDSFANGFFVHDKKQRRTFYFGLDSRSTDLLIEGNKSMLLIEDDVDCSNIIKIISVDKKLKSIVRLNYNEGNLLTGSRVLENGLSELVCVSSCKPSEKKGLDSLTLGGLYNLLDGVQESGIICSGDIQFLAKTDFNLEEDKFLWFVPHNFYVRD